MTGGKTGSWIAALFPFLRWLPVHKQNLRADIFAGVTVALVLIPPSMAYAQPAGLPAYYGLYAFLLPVIMGALMLLKRYAPPDREFLGRERCP